jgi:hypothetical protein
MSTNVEEVLMRRVIALLVCLQAIPAAAFAQTTDVCFDKALSTSLASVAKAMNATIRRDLAEANIVYMRLKGHVPPSTATAQRSQQ